jgi:hypothetical protein
MNDRSLNIVLFQGCFHCICTCRFCLACTLCPFPVAIYDAVSLSYSHTLEMFLALPQIMYHSESPYDYSVVSLLLFVPVYALLLPG